MKTEAVIRALEELNMENIRLASTEEMRLGGELVRLREKLSAGIIWYPLARFKRQRALRRIPGEKHPFNWDEHTWKTLLREGDPNKKVAVYTCITGQYDGAQRPLYYTDHCDYILFTDQPASEDAKGWAVKPIPEEILHLGDNVMINRYLKMHPAELFRDSYDFAIYIDGNIKPVTDLSVLCELINPSVGLATHRHCHWVSIYDEITACRMMEKGDGEKLEEQEKRYREAGFPEGFGMAECNVIITDLKSEKAEGLLSGWWEEFRDSASGRDQTSLPYVVWKMGHKMNEITTLGENASLNPKIRVGGHKR